MFIVIKTFSDYHPI